MASQQHDVSLLTDPVAQRLLRSPVLARLAYTWYDGTPRVVPMWFHWNGNEIVLGGPPDAPKVKALQKRSDVAVSIDETEWPYKVLLIRGQATIDVVNGVSEEYQQSARKYFGDQQGDAWSANVGQMMTEMARISIRPTKVTVLDFETRFPSALAKRMVG
jgi:Pyridoxamine 5'-phosphate oxidase